MFVYNFRIILFLSVFNMVVLFCDAQTYYNHTIYTTSQISFDSNNNFSYSVIWCHSPLLYGNTLTMSFGKYVKFKKKAYYLFSSPDSPGNDIAYSVTESKINLNGSFTIELLSPFDSLIKKVSLADNVFVYCITLYYSYSHNSIDSSNNNTKDTVYTYYTSLNRMEFKRPSNMNLKGFTIEIIPYRIEGNITKRYLSTGYYTVKDIYSNNFVVNLSNFTSKSFCYEFFYNEPVVILDNNSIAINREIFQIKEKRIKHYRKIGKWYYNYFNIRDPYPENDDF